MGKLTIRCALVRNPPPHIPRDQTRSRQPHRRPKPKLSLWWGRLELRPNDLGDWSGKAFCGVSGGRPGRYEFLFERWCRQRGHLWVRTAELAWAIGYYGEGFPSQVKESIVRERWREEKNSRREVMAEIEYQRRLKRERKTDDTVLRLSNGWVLFPRYYDRVRQCFRDVDLARLSGRERQDFLDDRAPDPGPWAPYLAAKGKYFAEERARYLAVAQFWSRCGTKARSALKRCMTYSNRRPESYPDCFVVFKDKSGKIEDCGFVEVKGPRESIRESQRRFFPELVRCCGQKVWLARFTMNETDVRFARFQSDGQLQPLEYRPFVPLMNGDRKCVQPPLTN